MEPDVPDKMFTVVIEERNIMDDYPHVQYQVMLSLITSLQCVCTCDVIPNEHRLQSVLRYHLDAQMVDSSQANSMAVWRISQGHKKLKQDAGLH